jgi:excisionase family DNA binding protein
MSTNQNNNSLKTFTGNERNTLLTVREVCQLLGIHSNTLRRWSDIGLLNAYRIGTGKHRRFKAEDIEALLIE